jgi:uncharacterized protein
MESSLGPTIGEAIASSKRRTEFAKATRVMSTFCWTDGADLPFRHRLLAAIRRCQPSILRILIVAGVAMGPVATARAQTFANGLSAFNVGDYTAAYSIWLSLAEQGDANSQSSIGYLFYEGKGVRQDSKIAARWYYLAASQGEPTAQSFLCEMHLRGDGVPRDLSLSLMWCELSIEGGEKRGIATRERVLAQMTEAQRDIAWNLAAQWREGRASAKASPANGMKMFTYDDRQ